MPRSPDSHKTENGIVAIIGGSLHMHGAPIFSALSAEASGVDLIFLALPQCHAEAAKSHSLNFQVHPFHGDDITEKDVDPLLQMLATVDAAVIGPGLSRTEAAQRVIRELIESAQCPMVLDASALQSWTADAVRGKQVILTPHLGELERMKIEPGRLQKTAQELGVTIHTKGPTDKIALPDGSLRTVQGGNAGLTVGGTGDALAGLICGLLAQHMTAEEACVTASKTIKHVAEMLEDDHGFAYGARRVIERIPEVLHSLP